MRKSMITLSIAAGAALAIVAPAGARSKQSGIPTGYYQCYQTTSTVWPPTGVRTYSTSFAKSFTLFGNRTYNVFAEGLFNRDNHWKFSRGKLSFSTGPMWAGFRHAVGHYQKPGVKMPNSTLNPTRRYPLVLHDARTGDSDTLPHRETADSSFWYCAKR
jgi:hypothetical protein